MKKHLWKIIAAIAIVAVLAGAFWVGGDSPGSRGWTVGEEPVDTPVVTPAAEPSEVPEVTPEPVPTPEQVPVAAPSEVPQENAPAPVATPAPPATPEPTPVPTPEPTPEPTTEADDGVMEVTISISCADVWDHTEFAQQGTLDILPEDGWILEAVTVPLNEGESAFNILQRTCKQNQIPMEFSLVPVLNTAYVEGIGNLYQFDVGETSGWKYAVNGAFPAVGCSGYVLSDGDVVEFMYACDLSTFEEDFLNGE